MRFIPERFKHNGLFIVMFFITVMMIITVSITITWTTIRMSEQFFIKKFSITNYKVMSQVKESFESFNYSVVLASNNLLQSNTIKNILTHEQFSNKEKLSAYFNTGQQLKHVETNLDAYEESILVMGRNGFSFATNRAYWPITDEELRTSILASNTFKEPKKLIYQLDKRKDGTNRRFIVASKVLMERINGTVYGSMYFAFEESEFRRFFTSYTGPGNNVFVVDKQGIIVSSNRSKLIGKKPEGLLSYADKIENSTDHYIIENFMGKDQIISMEYLPSFDMYLFNMIDKQKAVGDLIDKKDIVLISMAIVFVALIIVLLATRRLTNSLSSLVKQIEDASKHEFHQYVSSAGTYETMKIGNAFNSMLDELHLYVDQLVESQKQKRNAELAALQQQINPHFLYNTLTSIKFMVQQGGKEETEATINALISLLQNTIGNVSETNTISQEVDNLKNYVLINQKRYGNRIKVNYFVAPDCLGYHVPKLILQPFMENSFFHGFNRKVSGFINVLVWQEESTLICEVVDNGDGMEISSENKLPNTKRKQQMFSGIGVRNVHERIQLIYGEPFGVTISSEVGEGTKVRVELPISSI
ncbi:sensor histidine kinase [Neobacillus sp. OS1-33]|uniref:sensor histidine kinase n=1 Tax=Neobacillus sp. OS1-33 TaxID=3070683 RepID=UPI0027E1BD70|nr:sensor histidine kinase [Neobacillus sp. OS1-33]WML23990.1 sensor histidine kinase [Neobacillus sp. OS1-33]